MLLTTSELDANIQWNSLKYLWKGTYCTSLGYSSYLSKLNPIKKGKMHNFIQLQTSAAEMLQLSLCNTITDVYWRHILPIQDTHFLNVQTGELISSARFNSSNSIVWALFQICGCTSESPSLLVSTGVHGHKRCTEWAHMSTSSESEVLDDWDSSWDSPHTNL